MTALKLDLTGNGSATITRRFAATPEQVFRAHTEAELLQQWMGVMDGWVMQSCVSDARAGGVLDISWAGPDGMMMRVAGHYKEVNPFHEIHHMEQMYMPDPTPENHCHTTFTEIDGGTVLKLVMQLPDEDTLHAMLETGMEAGMNESYDRIDGLFS